MYKNSFDIASLNYDKTFTHSVIGKLQRNYVYKHFSEILKDKNPNTILEVNCGTGEDAIWLAKQNFQVTATDISEKMIAVSKGKNQFENLNFETLDINKLSGRFTSEKFDLLFSNFGGLNCLAKKELELFFENASKTLTQKGQLVLVIMPRNTLWEHFYFLLKGSFKNAFRRKKESAIANVDGENITTYYYNPKEVVNLALKHFDYKTSKPIGFFVPPSYLEPFFKNKKRLVSVLNSLENTITNISFLSKYADHYLIVMQKK